MNGKHGKKSPNRGDEKTKNPKENDVNLKWIREGIDQDAIEFCERKSKKLVEGNLSTSQIRNFYGEVMRIKAKGYNSEKEAILMLRPKLAYASAQKGKSSRGSQMLNEMLQPVLKEAAKSEVAFLNFCQFFEALLAFHKANGGKD